MRTVIIKSIPFMLIALVLTLVLDRPFPERILKHTTLPNTQANTQASTLPSAEASGWEAGISAIRNTVKEGETLSVIFSAYAIGPESLNPLIATARDIYNLARLRVGNPYTLSIDAMGILQTFTYQHKEEMLLKVYQDNAGWVAEEVDIPYERQSAHLGGVIRDNLVSSIDNLPLALNLSDIFAWDIDFATGLRKGDTFKAVVETLYRDGEFKKYGRILAAEFVNSGKVFRAYRFTPADGIAVIKKAEHFAADGSSLRRAFLKAPLTYRRISSRYSYGRFHPILKTVRPHLGVDYSARRGTPVSSVGDGTVRFAGWKGPNGNLVIIKHSGSYTTSYGHLQKIARGVRRGKRVTQGQLIGWVGSTGRSTGPHLDYRIKQGGRFVNPTRLIMPREKAVPEKDLKDFIALRDKMNMRLASIITGETLVANYKDN